MRKINRRAVLSILAAAVGGAYAFLGSPLVPTAQARWHDHPKLEAAYHQLHDAKEYLEAAPHDFHGHRKEAVIAINHAMGQIALCAEEEHKLNLDPAPLDEHPRLHKAKEHLKEAREYLHKASHDFHGHRVKAIEAIDEAIIQIDHCLR